LIAVAITSNIRLAAAPGNLLLAAKNSKLPKDSVINVSQIITIEKSFLNEKVHTLPNAIMGQVDEGLRLVLKL
jgi:mRNA interferase MazF